MEQEGIRILDKREQTETLNLIKLLDHQKRLNRNYEEKIENLMSENEKLKSQIQESSFLPTPSPSTEFKPFQSKTIAANQTSQPFVPIQEGTDLVKFRKSYANSRSASTSDKQVVFNRSTHRSK